MVSAAADKSPNAVEITEIFDAAAATSNFEFLDQDLIQLPSVKSLKAMQVIVRLDGCIVLYYATNVRVRTRPILQQNFSAYVTFGPDTTGTANGLPIHGNMMMVVPAGHRIAVVAEPDYKSATFLVRPEDITDHLSTDGQAEYLQILRKTELIEVAEDKVGRLFDWGQRLVDSAIKQPELFNVSRDHRLAAREDLLEILLATLASSSKRELDRRDRTRQAQSDIVRAAEQYSLSHTNDRLYVKDLCQATCVSERTLEYAFRAVMNLSPTTYLTRIRLHRVREALLRAKETQTTVTNVALHWGFWHFGEFAKAYKECFSELPSDTLRRAQRT